VKSSRALTQPVSSRFWEKVVSQAALVAARPSRSAENSMSHTLKHYFLLRKSQAVLHETRIPKRFSFEAIKKAGYLGLDAPS
jgi:hypothetical protein